MFRGWNNLNAPAMMVLVIAGVLAVPDVALAEESSVSEEEEEYHEVQPFPERRFMALIRFAPGLSIVPGQDEVARFDCDVSIALRLDLTRRERAWLSFVPEVGYSYHNGDLLGGHYGMIGLGLRFGSNWIAVNPMAVALLGARTGHFDVGVRAGIRILAALDLLGLEVAYEYRRLTGDGEDLHGVRLVVVFDIGVVFMPSLLTRFGYSFGRGEQ